MNQAIPFLFQVLFFFTPLLLWPKNSEVFEFPKMLFVYGLTILITTTWILNWIKAKKITIRRTPLDLPILLFLLIQVLSTIFSQNTYTSIWGYYSRFHGGLASTISYILLYYALVTNLNKKDILKVVNTILLSASLISAYAILEHFGIDKNLWVQDVQSRVFSTLGQPNWLSAYLVAILPLPILLFINQLKNFKAPNSGSQPARDVRTSSLWVLKFAYLLLSLLIIASIIFTKSQSGIATMTIILFLIILKTNFKIPNLARSQPVDVRTRSLMVLKFVIPFLTLLFIFYTKPQAIIKPLSSLNQINPFYSTTKEIALKDLETRANGGSDSMAIRRVVWQGAIDLGLKYPLLGTGPETFAYSYYQQRPVEHNLLSEWDFLYNKAHNEYLNFLSTTGFLGLGSYLLLIIWITVWWIKAIKQDFKTSNSGSQPACDVRTSSLRVLKSAIQLALFIGWLSILITNFFGFSVVAVALLFFLLPAINLLHTTKFKTLNQSLPESANIYLTPLTLILSLFLLSSLVKTFKADLSYNLGRSHATANQNKEALELLGKAVALQPKQPIFLAQLAEVEAKTAATIFLQLDSLPEGAKVLQETYQEQALNHAKKAVNLNPHHLNLYKSQARVEIYLSNIDQKYTGQALNALLQASLKAPTDPKLLFNIAILYQTLGKPDLAITSYQKAIDLKPNYPEAIQRLKKLQP